LYIPLNDWYLSATTGRENGGRGSNGGVWEWTSTALDTHEGLAPTDLFTGYTTDFFDTKHQVAVSYVAAVYSGSLLISIFISLAPLMPQYPDSQVVGPFETSINTTTHTHGSVLVWFMTYDTFDIITCIHVLSLLGI
jgi:hypothetical protein